MLYCRRFFMGGPNDISEVLPEILQFYRVKKVAFCKFSRETRKKGNKLPANRWQLGGV